MWSSAEVLLLPPCELRRSLVTVSAPKLYQKVATPPCFSAKAWQCCRWKALMKKRWLICVCLRQNCLYLCRSSGTQLPFTCWEVRWCAERRWVCSLLQGWRALPDRQLAVGWTSEISLSRHGWFSVSLLYSSVILWFPVSVRLNSLVAIIFNSFGMQNGKMCSKFLFSFL